MSVPYQICDLKIFSPFPWFPFYPLNNAIWFLFGGYKEIKGLFFFSFIPFMYSYTASFSDMLSLIATKVALLSCGRDF